MEQELPQPDETITKKYLRNYTEEGREKQKAHLNNIRQKAMEKKKELKEITLKSKLMKLEPKLELAKQYDEYINNKNQIQQQEPEEQIIYTQKPKERKKKIIYKEVEEEPEEQIVYIQKPKERNKKIIYKEVEEEEEEEQIVYIKKNKPKPQPQSSETLEKTLYKSSTEQLHLRAVEERIKHNFTSCYNALMPREY